MSTPAPDPTLSADEVGRFARMAKEWWDPNGKFRPLHAMNPVRCAYIRDRIAAHFGRDPLAPHPLAGLALLDAGAGGGLVAEPMTRLGARVTGVDAEPETVGVARAHARSSGLDIDYREGTVGLAAPERFDAVLALEIVEHTNDVAGFVTGIAARLKPGGIAVFSTLNRTAASLLKAKIAAEYVLGWLPPGTHSFRKFVRPSELAAAARRAGLRVGDLSGMTYDPLTRFWSLSRNLSVNYLMTAVRPDPTPRPVCDYGGLEAGPVPRIEHPPDDFGRRVDAMKALVEAGDPRLTTDASRRGQEELPQELYDGVAYYERWLLALKSNLVELGYFTEDEIAERIARYERNEGP